MDYRKYYKEYYKIEFDDNYAIHHMDFDRRNNDISDLILLPRKLHAKYHLVLNVLSICPKKPVADGYIDFTLSNSEMTDYNSKMLEKLPDVIKECNKWIRYKEYSYDLDEVKFLRGE